VNYIFVVLDENIIFRIINYLFLTYKAFEIFYGEIIFVSKWVVDDFKFKLY